MRQLGETRLRELDRPQLFRFAAFDRFEEAATSNTIVESNDVLRKGEGRKGKGESGCTWDWIVSFGCDRSIEFDFARFLRSAEDEQAVKTRTLFRSLSGLEGHLG